MFRKLLDAVSSRYDIGPRGLWVARLDKAQWGRIHATLPTMNITVFLVGRYAVEFVRR